MTDRRKTRWPEREGANEKRSSRVRVGRRKGGVGRGELENRLDVVVHIRRVFTVRLYRSWKEGEGAEGKEFRSASKGR